LFVVEKGFELGRGGNDSFHFLRRGIGEPEGSPRRRNDDFE
jgi:hypothetical protein